MPRFDGTGPQGQGPMTGRGAGYCADGDDAEFLPARPRLGARFARWLNPGRMFGRGRGAGRGRQRGNRGQ